MRTRLRRSPASSPCGGVSSSWRLLFLGARLFRTEGNRIKIMEILESLEVRWFMKQEQSAAAALQKWFASTPDEGERADHYLATDRNDLSFKARLSAGKPAKVETKYLVGSLGVVDLAPHMIGELQHWTKLSLALNDPKLKQHGAWLEVKKTRQLRKFDVSTAPALLAKEVAADAFVPIGCGVELTRLEYQIADTPRIEWTFGLEAFGPKTQLLEVLRATVESIKAQAGLPPLRPSQTLSYASWLLALPGAAAIGSLGVVGP